MKVKVFSLDGNAAGEIDLPQVFETEIRGDLIKRAVLSAQSSRYQPWGSDWMAGKRTSAETWGKGFGVSRVRRVKGTRYPASGMGAFNPHTVGGRRAHPPKTEKIIRERINKKEKRLAIRSAIAATAHSNIVSSRGHAVEGILQIPLVVTDELETFTRAEQVKNALKNIGAWNDVLRVRDGIKVRAGRGKMRGRRYRSKVGPLIVVSKDRGISKGARNFPGVNVAGVQRLNAEMLAPGGKPGRLTIWTKGAIEKLSGGMTA